MQDFYLGTHKPQWLKRTSVPLFVSRVTLSERKAWPRALGPWALDSGGFTELERNHGWEMSPEEYVRFVRRCRDEIGNMVWAAPQDWMCEPHMLQNTGRTVAEHIRLTVENLLVL